jgi:hypothetical protein
VRERLWEFSVQPRVPLPRMPARTMTGSACHFDRVFVIFIENPDFDEEIAELNSAGSALLTPFVTQLATSYGLETYYFGGAHPSLPNLSTAE